MQTGNVSSKEESKSTRKSYYVFKFDNESGKIAIIGTNAEETSLSREMDRIARISDFCVLHIEGFDLDEKLSKLKRFYYAEIVPLFISKLYIEDFVHRGKGVPEKKYAEAFLRKKVFESMDEAGLKFHRAEICRASEPSNTDVSYLSIRDFSQKEFEIYLSYCNTFIHNFSKLN